ncbi:MAG: diguanylate cyclase [Erysipelotrichia bacterium]|nr:diguanylate cyclase [Candidatus Riflebacteria bacterium]NCB37306.1 diguanylate cyclase [Erysipelotrichia bacterium]
MNSHEHLEVLEFHASLAEKTANAADLHLLVESIIAEAVAFMNASSGSIMVFDNEESCLKLYISAHHPGLKHGKTHGPVAKLPPDRGIAGQVFSSGNAIIVEDMQKNTEQLNLQGRNDSGSFLSMPLKFNQRIIGVMNFNRSIKYPGFTADDLKKLSSVDTLIAGLIDKEHMLETIEENRREIAGLYAMSTILSETNDFTGRLEEFLTKLSERLSLERSAVICMNSLTGGGLEGMNDGNNFEILAAHKLKTTQLQKMFGAVSSRLKRQLLRPLSTLSSDEEIQTPLTLTFEENGSTRELFCLPLVVEGQPSHMLLVSRKYLSEDAEQARKHYRFLYLISQNLSMAIARENMLKRIREDQEILLENATRNRIFLEISKDLASTLDPYTILQKAFDQFRKVISFTSISIMLFDDLDNTYRLIVQPGEPISVKFQKKLAETVFDVFSDYPADPPLKAENFHKPVFFNPQTQTSKPVNDFKHSLHLPIIITEKVRGLIHLARKDNRPFSKHELDITSQFTGIFITSIKNALIHKRTEKLAFTDPLTELFNHRYFQETLAHEFIRAKRYSKPLSLMVIDIDFFKKFNDSYGHLVGDKVLRHVAAIFKNSVREQIDTVARYGGEEFAVVLPETAIDGAWRFAERIRASVEASRIQEGDMQLSVTLSIGVASTLVTHCEKTSDLIEAADIALYRAKDNGRNQVIKYDESQLKNAKK